VKPAHSRIVSTVALTAATVVMVATVTQAITRDSWAPIWLTGWLPPILLAISVTCRAGVARRVRNKSMENPAATTRTSDVRFRPS
jgi:hypothetical protein